MSSTCPTEDDLIALLDGEATENRATELRAHLQRCASCQGVRASLAQLRDAIAAPLPGVPEEGAVERILGRLAAEPAEPAEPPRPPRAPRRRALALAVAGALAAAAAVLMAPRFGADPGEVTARGARPRIPGAARALHREVGVTVRRGGGDRLAPLAEGDVVTGETTYAVSYRNLGARGSAFLMVFAVDSAHAVHWIHPAYLEPGDDPLSLPLDHATEDRLLPAAVALEGPAVGDLSVITLVTPQPLRVSQIEALGAGEIEPGPLQTRFPEADVARVTLRLH